MLKGIHPLLTADLLHALRSMGHGDEIAIVDANFPATRLARRLVTLPGASSRDALSAILTLLPVDGFEPIPVLTMRNAAPSAGVPEPVTEFTQALAQARFDVKRMGTLDRQPFYERARDAFAIVQTGELRAFGNILLVKGIVNDFPAP